MPYFLDIKNNFTGKLFLFFYLNFNPIIIQNNEGFIFIKNSIINSYIFDFNEKLIYKKG